jgi:hypothetical protein
MKLIWVGCESNGGVIHNVVHKITNDILVTLSVFLKNGSNEMKMNEILQCRNSVKSVEGL